MSLSCRCRSASGTHGGSSKHPSLRSAYSFVRTQSSRHLQVMMPTLVGQRLAAGRYDPSRRACICSCRTSATDRGLSPTMRENPRVCFEVEHVERCSCSRTFRRNRTCGDTRHLPAYRWRRLRSRRSRCAADLQRISRQRSHPSKRLACGVVILVDRDDLVATHHRRLSHRNSLGAVTASAEPESDGAHHKCEQRGSADPDDGRAAPARPLATF